MCGVPSARPLTPNHRSEGSGCCHPEFSFDDQVAGPAVLEPRGSKWSKWVQGKGERKRRRCEEEWNREVVAEPKTERVEGERCRGGTTHARRREAVDAARGPPEDGQGGAGGSARRAVPRRDHACAPTRGRRRSARSACRFAEGWDPAVAEAFPLDPHRRDVIYLPFFSGFCPGFCPGLSRARYDSPSMTRS
jgi:hypothetical protein